MVDNRPGSVTADQKVVSVGRKQRPLKVTNEVEHLAMRLRAVRAAARLTVRKLAEKTGYAHSTVSKAESGRHLPSWEVVEAIVQACGDNPADWHSAWQAAQHPVRPAVAGGLAEETTPAHIPASEERLAGTPDGHPRPVRRRRAPATAGSGVLVVAVILVLIGLITIGIISLNGDKREQAHTPLSSGSAAVSPVSGAPHSTLSLADDTDPSYVPGCASRAIVMEHDSVTASVNGTVDRPVGEVELRKGGSGCLGGWARFVPNPDLPNGSATTRCLSGPTG